MSREARLVRTLQRSARLAATVIMLGASLILIGWQFDLRFLQAIGPVDVVMNPMAALLFVLTGSVLVLAQSSASPVARVWSVACGVFIAVCGALVFMRSVAGWNAGVDEWLFRAKVLSVQPPDWMAGNTALNFALLGIALALQRPRTNSAWRPAHWIALPVALISLLVVIGYLYNAAGFITFQLQLPMALNTALFFLAACFALVARSPEEGVMALFVSDSAGGALTRRLLPALLLVPLVLGVLVNMGQGFGWYGSTVGLALLTLATIVLSVVLTITTAGALHRSDVTMRRAKEEAERANRAKSEFLSRMSHELRTPMNAILGFAQLLERKVKEPDQAKHVGHILKGGKHLLGLINEVLDLARIDAGRLALSVEPVRVNEVIREAIDLVRPLADDTGIELIHEDAAHEVFAAADRQRLSQVLLNLLSNAIKYNRAGGQVRITVQSQASGVSVRVSDDGRGIPDERRDQLFTPFARLGADDTDTEGAGLGLALSRGLAEAMAGALVLEETGTDGSTFRLDLAGAADPLLATTLIQPPQPGSAEPGSEGTVLYIEDNLTNVRLVEAVLESKPGWKTVTALRGEAGIMLAREKNPDLILMDLHLPDMPGMDVLGRLRADPATAHIPVVIISADATAASKTDLLAAGANAYLTKPLDLDEFVSVVERFLPVRATAG